MTSLIARLMWESQLRRLGAITNDDTTYSCGGAVVIEEDGGGWYRTRIHVRRHGYQRPMTVNFLSVERHIHHRYKQTGAERYRTTARGVLLNKTTPVGCPTAANTAKPRTSDLTLTTGRLQRLIPAPATGTIKNDELR